MANKTFNITGKINLDISKVQSQMSNMQKTLSNLKLPKDMSTKFSDIFTKLNSELANYQERLNKGFKTKSDVTGLEKTGNIITNTLKSLDKEWSKLSKLNLSEIVKLNPDDAKRVQEIDEQIKLLSQNVAKVSVGNLQKFEKAVEKISTKKTYPLLKNLVGDGNYEKALSTVIGKLNVLNSIKERNKGNDTTKVDASIAAYREMEAALIDIINEHNQLNITSNNLKAEKLNIYANAATNAKNQVDALGNELNQSTNEVNRNSEAIQRNAQRMQQWNSEVDMVKNQATYFFGLSNSINLVKRALRSAYETVKELDAAMTETAVVTDMTISDLWGALPKYTSEANKLGTTTLGAYQTMTLYYQQGLKTNEVFEIGSETMKMARIASLEYTEATDLMTAALRGFNMELNETSAQRVNDVYSKLAAITASDTEEIATAMTKTASIANAANMEFETTAAFLTQMIETTRESAENLGTAMKTIIARFTEMKKAPNGIIEVEGEEVDVNKVDTALRSVGVALKDTTGQFRDLDDVFLELAKKWDTLDLMQQRYVATTAAGSRQQSRFIAMMDNYDRTMELVDAANNSAGASNEQFSKTVDSLESKLNKLSNAWNEFTMGLANSTVIKTGVDMLTTLLELVNNITGAFGDGVGGVLKFGAAIGGIKLGKNLVNKGFSKIGTALGTREPSEEKKGGLFGSLSRAGTKTRRVASNVKGSFVNVKQTNRTSIILKDIEKQKKDLLKAQKELQIIQAKGNGLDERTNALGTHTNSKKPKVQAAVAKKRQADAAFAELEGNAKAKLTAINQTLAASYDKLGFSEAQVNLLESTGLTQSELAILLSNEESAALIRETLANEALSDEEKKEQLIQARGIAQEKLSLSQKIAYYAQLLFGNQVTRQSAAQHLGLAAAETAEGGAATFAAKAQGLLSKALMTLPIGWIIAGIAAAGAAFAIWNAVVETNEEKLERLTVTSKELSDQLAETQEKISSLSEDREGLSALTKEFDDLSQGTAEWKQKLVEVNQQVLSLIEKYPELAKYLSTGEGGVLEIDEKGWEATQDKLVKSAQAISVASLNTNIEKAKTQQVENRQGVIAELGNILPEVSQPDGTSKKLEGEEIGKVLDTFLQQGKTVVTEADFSGLEISLSTDTEYKNQALDIINEYLSSNMAENVAIEKEKEALSAALVDGTEFINSKYAEQLKGITSSSELFEKERLKDEKEGGHDWGWDFFGIHDISKYAKEEYAKITGLTIDEINEKIEDKSLSKDTIRTAVTSAHAQENLSKTLKDVEVAFKDLEKTLGSTSDEFKGISNLVSSGGTGLTKDETEALKYIDVDKDNTFSEDEVREYLTGKGITIDEEGMTSLGITVEEFTNRIETSVDSWEDIYNQADKYGLRNLVEPLINNLTNGLKYGLDFTAKQATSISNILSQVEATGGDAEELSGYFEGIFAQVKNPEDLEKIVTLLSGTDWTSSSSIESAVKGLEDFGIECDKDLTPALIDVTKAIDDIDVDKLKETTKTILNFVKDLKDREETERSFSEEDYNAIAPLLSEELKKDFVFDGTEFVYVGDSIQDLITALEENTKSKLEERKESLTGQVERGKNWKDKIESDNEFSDVVDKVLSGEYSEKYGSGINSRGIPNSVVAAKKLDEYLKSLGYDITASNTLESAVEQFKKYMSDYSNLSSNEAQLKTISNPLLLAGTTANDIKKSTAAYEDKAEAINKLIKTTEGAEEKSKALTEQFKKEGKAVDTNSVKLLAVELTNAERAIDKINSTISDYEKSLQAKDGSLDYYAGIEELTKQSKIVFGEDVDSTWVEENLDNLLKLAEGGDVAKKALEELYATEKAKKFTVMSYVGEENTLNTFMTTIDALVEKTANGAADVTSEIQTISSALNDLNNSDVSFEVKAKTKAALADLIKTGMVKAVVSGKKAQFESLYRLAISSGLTMSGVQGVLGRAIVEKGKVSYEFGDDAAEKVGNITFGNLGAEAERTEIEVDVSPNYYGSGLDTNKYDDDEDDDDKWENSYDKLYNLTEDINENLRERERLEREYNKLLEDRESSAIDIYENYKAQLENLQQQRKLQQQMVNSRKQEIANTVASNSNLQSYARYNWNDMTIEIDWGRINQVSDPDLGERIENYVSKLEELQSSMDDANDAISEIEETTKELEEQGHDDMVDFEQRIMDAIIDREEKQIEKLETIDESITDGNSKLLDSIQNNLDKLRQDRENDKTEQELADKEARLSYLQLDTSGANDLAIAELEKEIAEGQQDYTDTLIDQKLTELQEQNEKASEERQAQIEVMKAQLEIAQSEGKYWSEVYRLITSGTDETGKLIHGSDLAAILKNTDNYSGLSKVQKMDWLSELEEQAKISIAQYSKENQLEKLGYYANQKVTFTNAAGESLTGIIQKDGSVKVSGNGGTYTYKDVYRAADGTFKTLESYGSFKKNVASGSGSGGSGSAKYRIGSYVQIKPNATIYKSSYGEGGDTQYFSDDPKYKIIGERNGYILTQHHSTTGYTGWFKPSSITKVTKYKTGGLADFTGPAWLDGTKSSPELVLNQQDTKNFLILKDVLSNLMNNTSKIGTSANNGDNYYEINIQVDKLENDYDVEDLANKVKKIIVDDSRYRNVNTINFLR